VYSLDQELKKLSKQGLLSNLEIKDWSDQLALLKALQNTNSENQEMGNTSARETSNSSNYKNQYIHDQETLPPEKGNLHSRSLSNPSIKFYQSGDLPLLDKVILNASSDMDVDVEKLVCLPRYLVGDILLIFKNYIRIPPYGEVDWRAH